MYKKVSELACNDLDKGCRKVIDQSTRARRKLKKKIRKADRKRLDNFIKQYYN